MRRNLQALIVALSFMGALSCPALTVIGRSGAAREESRIRGTIVRVDQNSITVHWMTHEGHWHSRSYEAAFQLTPQTHYENCTWSSLSKGAVVSLYGHGNIVDRLQLGK